jgi:poly-gamma-glutamate capsule biosynthesis protein CapA/YwtB (metallophosphatase superfamily)
MVHGNLLRERWGLIQAIGLETFAAGKFTPFSLVFINILTTIDKEKKKKQKEKKINHLQCFCL